MPTSYERAVSTVDELISDLWKAKQNQSEKLYIYIYMKSVLKIESFFAR